MKKEDVVGALMNYAPRAKWDINPDTNPIDMQYTDIIWEDDFFEVPSHEKLLELIEHVKKVNQSQTNYQFQRRGAYPSIDDQLDYIFHNGVDAWKEKIQAIKDKYPKP